MPKPLADHGTYARANGRPSQGIKGCDCQRCRRAEAVYVKRRNYLNATGRPLMVDTEPVTAHLETLFAAGAGWTQLADATGCSSSTIFAIRRRTSPKILRTTAEKILAVTPGAAQPPRRPISSIGTRRRIQALMTIGHSMRAIAAEADGMDVSIVREALNGTRRAAVTSQTAARIARAYRRLATIPGTNTRARTRAAANGWHGPLAWDDIDNPAAEPDLTGVATPQRLKRRSQPDDIAAEVRHLAALGESSHSIARALGRSEKRISQLMPERYGEAA